MPYLKPKAKLDQRADRVPAFEHTLSSVGLSFGHTGNGKLYHVSGCSAISSSSYSSGFGLRD